MDEIPPTPSRLSGSDPRSTAQSESQLHLRAHLHGEVESERMRRAWSSGATSAKPPFALEELSRRRSAFAILIHGESRIAWNLLALLLGSGFDDVAIISHGARPAPRIAVEEFTALAITNDEIGLERKVVSERLRARSSVHSAANVRGEFRAPPPAPSLIISLQIPLHDYRQRWMSESTPHLIVEVKDGVAWIGPYVLPGVTPCIQCYLLHERDSAALIENDLFQSGAIDVVNENETSVAASALAAAVIATEVSSLVTDSVLPLIGSRVAINLLEPTLEIRAQRWDRTQPELLVVPPLKSFDFHPECGCVGGQLSS